MTRSQHTHTHSVEQHSTAQHIKPIHAFMCTHVIRQRDKTHTITMHRTQTDQQKQQLQCEMPLFKRENDMKYKCRFINGCFPIHTFAPIRARSAVRAAFRPDYFRHSSLFLSF